MTERLSRTLVDWIESFAPGSSAGGRSLVVMAGSDSYELLPLSGDRWQAGFRERGVLRVEMQGRRAYAERFFVWFTVESARRPTRDGYSGLSAPWRFAADGPLQVRAGRGGWVEVLAEGEVVAEFTHSIGGGDAYSFTHYGFLPLELLIAQVAGPDDDLIFPIGHRYRSEEEQRADARRIQVGVERLLAGTAPDSSDRLVGVYEVRRRLHLFRFVYALPKDVGGDSLQIAFRVSDERAGRDLLSTLRLAEANGPSEVQHPVDGPFDGAAVIADLVSSALTPTADTMHAWLVQVRLWNETGVNADLYQVTARLVEQAAEIEARLVALGLHRHPREIGLLGFDNG